MQSAPRLFALLPAAVVWLACGAAADAWEGHDWQKWRAVTTWTRPEIHTDQAGRAELVPLLGRSADGQTVIRSISDWQVRREHTARVIQQILGSPSPLDVPPLEVRESETIELDGYTRRHVLIHSEPDDWIPAYLLVPNTLRSQPAPAVVCLHQTVAQGKEEPCGMRGDPELAFAVELVKRGYVCVAPDAIGFGERIPPGTQPYHDSISFYQRHPGWSFMGKMIWDVGRVIDYLESLSFVDSDRIGSIGHSHGGYGTLFASAFEPRISAAVASCGFTTFRCDPSPERWSHLTALMPQLGFYLPDVAEIPFDWQDVLALSAPRSLFVWYATEDTIFPRTENLEGLLRDVQSVYEIHGAVSRLQWQSFDGPHRFPPSGREIAYRWLDENL